MNSENNKEIICKWIKARNANDLEAAVALWADDLRDQVKQGFNSVTEAFPDVQIAAEEMIAVDNKVALRWTFLGTHLGTFKDIPATGNVVKWSGIDFYTIINGEISSLIREANSLNLLQQLNVVVSFQGRVLL